jgi:hypothetical protein
MGGLIDVIGTAALIEGSRLHVLQTKCIMVHGSWVNSSQMFPRMPDID